MALESPSESEESMVNRPRGFLTKKDRTFLLGKHHDEISKNAWNQRRFQIRRRARNALIDFILLSNLPDKDIELIFDNYDSSTHSTEEAAIDLLAADTDLTYGLIDLFEVVTIGIGPAKAQALFANGFTKGVDYLGARSDDVLLNYEIHDGLISLSEEGHTPLDEVQTRFEEGEEMSGRELDVLVKTGRITPDEYIQKYKQLFISGLQE